MSRQDVHNGQDVIDSCDVIARIEELETELRDAYEAEDETQAEAFPDWLKAAAENDAHTLQDTAQELQVLFTLQDEASGSPDWRHGETLIRDSYFESYAQELAEDIGAISRDAGWPNNHIDWEAAAEALQQNYTSVEFDGVTYWIRS